MKNRVCLLSLLMSLFVAGCADFGQPTGYHPVDWTGGYSETQLAPDVWRIKFDANSLTSSEQTSDMALLRAADLCLQGGYANFAVTSSQNLTQQRTTTTPGFAYGMGTAAPVGNTSVYNGGTIYAPPQTTTESGPPSVEIWIRCYQTKPDDVSTYNAAFLMRSLKQKYNIQ